MKYFAIAIALLAVAACASFTAPHNDGGCPPGYILSSGRQCVPG